MIKVFINNIQVSFSDKVDKDKDTYNLLYQHHNLFQKVYYLCADADNDNNDFGKINIIDSNPKKCFDSFKNEFKKIKAAGGIVKNGKGKFLMIYRLGYWDLPKGKMESGEKKRETALREVEEECGLSNLKITKKLPSTYHMYEFKSTPIIKTTYWYEMRYDGEEPLIPQIEEDITEAQWCSPDFVYDVIKNKTTYGSIELLLKEYLS